MSNDPDLLDEWVECHVCMAQGTVTDIEGFDIDCPECAGDGGWEQER